MAKKKTAKKKTSEYVATVGGNYGDDNTRFEAGDIISESDMPKKIFKAFLDDGVIIEQPEGENGSL